MYKLCHNPAVILQWLGIRIQTRRKSSTTVISKIHSPTAATPSTLVFSAGAKTKIVLISSSVRSVGFILRSKEHNDTQLLYHAVRER